MSKKKDDYYFSHDMGARNDGKITALRMKHGWAGYGLFWALVETLRAEKTNIYPMPDLPVLAYALQAESNMLENIIKDYGLFKFKTIDDVEYFYSARLCETVEIFKSKKEKRIEAGRKGGLSNAKAMLEQASSDDEANCSKEKKSKVKKSKEKKDKDMCDFEEVFLALPARNGKRLEKGVAYQRYLQEPLKDRPDILQAAKNYANSDLVKRNIGIKDPKRFLSNWKDWRQAETGNNNGAVSLSTAEGRDEYERKLEETLSKG